jgi:hypothetical protein
MSGFQSPAKKKWVDSESESDHEGQYSRGKDELISEADGIRKAEAEQSESESESESDSSSDDGEDSKLRLTAPQPAPVKKEKVVQLSKKEQLERRQKELNELDSLLAEFGTVNVETSTQEAVPAAAVEESTEVTENAASNSDKKKKKKKPSSTKKSEKAEEAPVEVTTSSAPVDVNAILKARTTKKSTKKAETSDALKIAMAEAQKSKDSSKKKKKDTSKFSEYSY